MQGRFLVMFGLAVLLLAATRLMTGQEHESSGRGYPPDIRLDSEQGVPDQPDVISHKHVAKDSRAQCIRAGHHPKGPDSVASCVLRLDSGEKYKLQIGESMRFPKDSEVYLECAGDKPTECSVGLW